MGPHLGKDYDAEPLVVHNSIFDKDSKETLDEYQERIHLRIRSSIEIHFKNILNSIRKHFIKVTYYLHALYNS